MKVTLNRAVKLRNKLETSLQSDKVVLVCSIRMIDEESVRSEYEKSKSDSIGNVDYIESHQSALFSLRDLIQNKNVSCGVNKLINKISFSQKMINHFSNQNSYRYNQSFTLVNSLDDMSYKKRLADSKSEPFAVVEVALVIPEVEEYMAERVRHHRSMVSNLEEERNKINHTTHLEIPDDIVEVLRSRDII